MKEETRVFTGGLNKDDDPRFLPNGDWIDALNASVLNREGTGGDIVTEIGNEEISLYRSSGATTYSLPSGTNTTIGSVDDPVRGHTYWFVHNSNNKHVILRYEYDTNIARLVWEDNSYAQSYNQFNLNFIGSFLSTTAYSKGDIVLDSGSYYTLLRENYISQKTITAYNNSTTTPLLTANLITLGLSPNYYKTGDKVVYSDNGGSVGGLTDGDTYYVISVTSATIKLANSFANAIDGVAIDLTGSLSGSPNLVHVNEVNDGSCWANISDTLNFSSSFQITHAVVVEQNERVYLIWTDNNEQPSFLEVTSINNLSPYPYLDRKFIDLYAFQPQHPMVCTIGTDSSIEQNSIAQKIFQFRYVWKFKDGRTTAMSPSSRLPLPSKYFYEDIHTDNKIDIEIPLPHNHENNIVEQVLVYAKENGTNNTGDYYLTEVLDVEDETVSEYDSPYSDRYLWYISKSFYNNSITSAVPTTVQNQVQDFIPVKSATLAVVGNGRVLLGNNTDGYDFDLSNLDVNFSAITTLNPSNLASNSGAKGHFKKNSRYPFGIVYGDRSGRLTNVLRDDTMYLDTPYWNLANRGEVMCKMTIAHAPPSWAEFWYPVFCGNQTTDKYIQSAAAAVTDPDLRLEDPNEYADKIDFPSYTYTFSNGQYIRVIEDFSESNYMPSSNGISQILKSNPDGTEPFEIRTNGFSDFTINPNTSDMVEVFSLSNKDPNQQVWYEMGWAFKIETDENGNRVHGGTNSFYTNVKNYTDTEFSITGVSGGSNDILTIGSNTLSTGDAILYKDGSGAISGLIDATVYYVIENTSTTIKLADSESNADSGISITGLNYYGAGSYIVGETDIVSCQSQIIGGANAQDCVVVLDQSDSYSIDIDFYEQSLAKTPMIESMDIFPFKNSKISVQGRPNLVNSNYKQNIREQEIVYSEPIVDNTDFFGANRFFDGSFSDSLNNAYGDLTVMHSDGNELFCIQETKVARILTNKNFLYQASGSQSLNVQTDTLLSEPQYFPQDFGCQNPESFSEYGGVKFWVDRLRGAVLMSAAGEVKNIAQIKMSSYFENNLAYPSPYNENSDTFANGNKIYSGYSIRGNSYYITLDAHKLIKRNVSTSGTEYTITMTALDIEDGTFDRLVDIGVVPIKSEVNTYDIVWEGLTITSSDSSAKTITVDSGVSIGTIFAGLIYVPFVQTISFSKDRGRWISRHSFTPEWMSSSGNSLVSFVDGKCYVHNLTSYQTAFFGTKFNYARYYGSDPAGALDDTVKNLFVEFPFNQEPNIVKEPITIATDSNQVFNIDYAVNESEQITDNETTDYEEFEGYYWSPIFKDKTTPVVTYPLLEGDLVKGKYLKARLKATTDGNQQASISSVKLKYNNSNLT